jgi:predicted flap endonuclease-1-like 5' DNA nuclease
MRVERNSGEVLVETGMFAAMVAVVATVLMMVVFAKDIVSAAAIGVAVGAVVAVAMWLLMRGTLEPPRGPGNLPRPERAPATAAKADAAPAAETAAAPSATAVADAPEADITEASDGHAGANGLASAVGTAPATLASARDGQPDDLKQIKGVGPKLEKLLHSMGFYHFDQIAAWSDDEIAWVDENLTGFKGRVTRDDWVAQARTLTSGG